MARLLLLKHQNKISEEKLAYLKDLERRMKALVIEWRKTEDKQSVIKTINSLLFKQREKHRSCLVYQELICITVLNSFHQKP